MDARGYAEKFREELIERSVSKFWKEARKECVNINTGNIRYIIHAKEIAASYCYK